MSGFLFTFLAVLLAGIGARDQVLVAGLTARQGQRGGVLLTAIAVSVVTAAVAAWAARLVVPLLPGSGARMFFAALALGLAGAELLLVRPKPPEGEPTHSLGATAIVLAAQQVTDAARFVILGLAAATGAPISAGIGGAAAGAAVIAVGWLAGEDLLKLRLRPVRIVAGAVLLGVTAWLAYGVLNR
jgi:putative Ca2+/H+ antiporter (TMEM165/GDT1 family)